jgi:hypothetical protein
LADDRKHTFNLGKIFFAASDCEYVREKYCRKMLAIRTRKCQKFSKKICSSKSFNLEKKLRLRDRKNGIEMQKSRVYSSKA